QRARAPGRPPDRASGWGSEAGTRPPAARAGGNPPPKRAFTSVRTGPPSVRKDWIVSGPSPPNVEHTRRAPSLHDSDAGSWSIVRPSTDSPPIVLILKRGT